jgi:hypothetical protein
MSKGTKVCTVLPDKLHAEFRIFCFWRNQTIDEVLRLLVQGAVKKVEPESRLAEPRLQEPRPAESRARAAPAPIVEDSEPYPVGIVCPACGNDLPLEAEKCVCGNNDLEGADVRLSDGRQDQPPDDWIAPRSEAPPPLIRATEPPKPQRTREEIAAEAQKWFDREMAKGLLSREECIAKARRCVSFSNGWEPAD